MKYIFDTDIGDDIDDAVALCAAVRGGLNLLGVTSVFLDTRRRCALARELLKEENSEIPVYCGRADRVVVCLDNLFPMCQYAVETLRGEDKEDDAVDFIIQSAEKYKKDLGIIAVGPLSNLAAAIERAPETMKKTGKIYLMGGFFFGTGKEWNIVCNPEAVQTVFSSGIPMVCAGLDVTEETILSESVQKKLLSGRGYVSDLSRRWYASRRGRITLHDLLVVWEALCEGSLVSEGYRVTVALTGKERGQTFAEKDENSPVRIAKGFSLTAFMNFFEREILEKSVLAF